jgi:hypothetical protein
VNKTDRVTIPDLIGEYFTKDEIQSWAQEFFLTRDFRFGFPYRGIIHPTAPLVPAFGSFFILRDSE